MRFITTLLLLCGLAPDAYAQNRDAPGGIKRGQTVWVTMADGSEVHGTVAGVSASAIDVLDNGTPTRLLVANVVRIDVPDPIVDGIQHGLTLGAAAGVGAAAIGAVHCANHPQPEGAGIVGCGAQGLYRAFRWGALSALGGILVGAIVDDEHKGRQTVYRRPPRFIVTPTVMPRGASLAAVVRW